METVEVPNWRKSSFSGGNGAECVEVGQTGDGMILMRDTKDRSKAPHKYTQAEWKAFTAGIRAGEFDLDESGRLP